MSELILTKDNFETEVLNSTLPVVVDFWASWCGPCRMLAPVISGLAEELEGKAVVGKVNVDDESELAAKYGIMTIPTVLLFKNGSVAATSVGVKPKAQLLDSLGL
ncbi:MAG: thioredoxin [Clostridia bacterium]|nr:thioredoxin [Clostridia bacterium]